IVMEYVEGRTVSQVFKKTVELKSSIPIPIAAYVVSEICNGLDYMHRRRDEQGRPLEIVHRDISPQNVIVAESGMVKIVDFGVAKAAFKLSEMERGVLKGKFAYMSPEQTEGKNIEAASDIFSTGVVLWEMLTGRRLFKKKSNAETVESVQSMAVFPPSSYRNEVPSDLDEIVMTALERDPVKRFAAASDMSLALTKFLLRHHPEFKPAQISDFLAEIFDNEESTIDLYQEKTMREELTVLERWSGQESGESIPELQEAEDTLIVDPQELDFHSIFEEIDVEEVSEITRAIGLGENSATEAMPASPTSPRPEEEITGDPIEYKPKKTAPIFTSSARPSRPRVSRKKPAMALLGVLVLLLLFAVFRWNFSNKPGQASFGSLQVLSEPAGAAIFINGKAVGKKTPALLSAEGLSFPLVLGLSLGESPTWGQRIETAPPQELKIEADLRAAAGSLDVETSPSGAAVKLEGFEIGKTPLRGYPLPADRPMNLSIELKGFKLYQNEISMAPGQKLRLYHELKREKLR
ncbi:MAG TPA: hypothetical protein DF383_11720, partial [Deltaproteobacteria bacterium]|nr:hypothetical protein [Deltaproteobacteria bacterium]